MLVSKTIYCLKSKISFIENRERILLPPLKGITTILHSCFGLSTSYGFGVRERAASYGNVNVRGPTYPNPAPLFTYILTILLLPSLAAQAPVVRVRTPNKNRSEEELVRVLHTFTYARIQTARGNGFKVIALSTY
jgi:hypothetical protein